MPKKTVIKQLIMLLCPIDTINIGFYNLGINRQEHRLSKKYAINSNNAELTQFFCNLLKTTKRNQK